MSTIMKDRHMYIDDFAGCKKKMNFFSDAMARLKYDLHVSKDTEVAALLGLSKTAFAERKRRGSFPEKELHFLAAKRPDLNLDVGYVMNGVRRSHAEHFKLTHALSRHVPDMCHGFDLRTSYGEFHIDAEDAAPFVRLLKRHVHKKLRLGREQDVS